MQLTAGVITRQLGGSATIIGGRTAGGSVAHGGYFPEYFEGPFEVTPSDEEQILDTAGLMCSQNVVINPIPSTYGRISWNGSVLTVS